MIKEKLQNFESKTFIEIIFFLKDYIYHSAYNNYLGIPENILELLNKKEIKILEGLISQIKNNANKEIHLKEINSIVSNKYLKKEKSIEEEAKSILNELSKSIPEKKEAVAEIISGDIVRTVQLRGGTRVRLTGEKHRNPRDINKLLKRRGQLKSRGYLKPFSVQANHDNEVVLREIQLQNGVTIRVVIDEDKFEKYKYGNPIITNQALDLIVRDFNKRMK